MSIDPDEAMSRLTSMADDAALTRYGRGPASELYDRVVQTREEMREALTCLVMLLVPDHGEPEAAPLDPSQPR